MSEPEETAPITPLGQDSPSQETPFVSPSGPPPPPAPAPSFAPPQQVPYGPPAGYGYQPWTPAYGAPYPGSASHKEAKTAMVLGIISIASLLTSLFCCVTFPGVLCAPFAWAKGAKAKREIEALPGVYGNASDAQAGMWMGIVMTFLGGLALVAVAVLAIWVGYTDPTLA